MLAVPTSVVEIIKNFLDALSNISAELLGYSVYFWMVLVMIMYFCTYVEERKFMVCPVAKFQTLHLIQTSPWAGREVHLCVSHRDCTHRGVHRVAPRTCWSPWCWCIKWDCVKVTCCSDIPFAFLDDAGQTQLHDFVSQSEVVKVASALEVAAKKQS